MNQLRSATQNARADMTRGQVFYLTSHVPGCKTPASYPSEIWAALRPMSVPADVIDDPLAPHCSPMR